MCVDLLVALVDRSKPTVVIEMLYSSNGRKQVLFCPESPSEADGGRDKKNDQASFQRQTSDDEIRFH
jgi:hypothetical protein